MDGQHEVIGEPGCTPGYTISSILVGIKSWWVAGNPGRFFWYNLKFKGLQWKFSSPKNIATFGCISW